MTESASRRALAGWGGLGGNTVAASSNKILAVDDNEALRYSLSRSLREAGYQVIEASTGQEALNRANADGPDLVMLDINLPDMSGFQVCRKLKADPATSHIPVLHVSSTFVEPEYRVRGLEGGADAYLTEPIYREELVATVGALLRLKQAESVARQQVAIAETARNDLAQLNATLEDRIRERTVELQQANESLKDLSAQLLQIRDEEQRRIARELHDGIGQLLAAIKMNHAAIAHESSKLNARSVQALEDSDTLVQEALRSIRTISYLLHPPLLDEAGLPSALKGYIAEFGQRSGIHISLHCPATFKRLPREFETSIFRIVQECLGNIHAHSGSSTAYVSLKVADGKIHLEVRDEGVGISPKRQEELNVHGRAGVGFRGIRERIGRWGGQLSIQSLPGKGTTVNVSVPYKIAASQEHS
jgi:signal transduction histidine kinase